MTTLTSSNELQHLLDRLRAGDDSVRDAVLQHSLERFQALASRMFQRERLLRTINETDDVLQKALVRLHAALRRVRPADARALFGLAARQIRWVLKNLAQEMAENKALSYQATPPEAEDHAGGTHDLLEWGDFHRKIEELPDEEREMFDLVFYDGLTQEEAAEVLDTSVRTVRRRWQRARLMLDAALHGEWPKVR